MSDKLDKINSPLLSLLFKIREFRNHETDYLLGKILTIIDSVVIGEKQNKAVKDVIKASWYERHYIWDDIEEVLRQFKSSFFPEIEDGYKYKLPEEDPNRPKCSSARYFN